MTIFGAIGIASTGVTVHRKWMDAVSDNIANINTAAKPGEDVFRTRYIEARAVDYGSGEGGVMVGGAVFGGNPDGKLAYDPNHPYADAEGYVRYPDIDLGGQMTGLIMAQRGYQANLAVVDRAKTAYEAALQLGRNA